MATKPRLNREQRLARRAYFERQAALSLSVRQVVRRNLRQGLNNLERTVCPTFSRICESANPAGGPIRVLYDPAYSSDRATYRGFNPVEKEHLAKDAGCAETRRIIRAYHNK